MHSPAIRTVALFTCLTVMAAGSGCTRLEPSQYEEHGYHGEAVVREGARILPVDWLGNLFGALTKLVLWNWKVKRHYILEDTEEAVDAYLAKNRAILGNVAVQLNRYAPQDAWKRLFANKRVKWPYRYTLGILTVLIYDTLLIDRIFGGDRYNPYTHTVHIHSDLPSIALHELGHARDFAERRYRGSYAALRIFPGADLYQEFQATRKVFDYVREENLTELEIEAYQVLYPAYGTYAGSYGTAFNYAAGVAAGHIVGRIRAGRLSRRTAPPAALKGTGTVSGKSSGDTVV